MLVCGDVVRPRDVALHGALEGVAAAVNLVVGAKVADCIVEAVVVTGEDVAEARQTDKLGGAGFDSEMGGVGGGCVVYRVDR